jgi:putative transposase
MLCRVLRVNRSTYYKHFNHPVAPRTLENQTIRCAILEIHSVFKKRFGAAKIKVVLSRDYGIHISIGRVYRLMKEMQLPKISTAKPKALFKSTSSDESFPNRLNKNFNVPAPNLVWCSDITYIRTSNGFAYLCVIIDLFSRMVIAYSLSHSMSSSLVIDALRIALHKRHPNSPPLFHSDRGSQYTSVSVRRFCDDNNISQSFSAKGHPYDNAVVESFFKFLKLEETNRKSFANISDLRLALFRYIDRFYNLSRPHSAINMLSPAIKDSL